MDKSQLPVWKSIPSPEDINRMVLPNGITLLTRQNFTSPSVVINGYYESGSAFDRDERLGEAYLTSLMLTRGTAQHSFQQIFEALESVAATLGFGVSIHTGNFGGRCLAEDLPMLMDLAADCLRNPIFPPEHMEKLRAQILTGLSLRQQDTLEMASLTFDQIVFNGHPYARPEDGYVDTIQRLTRDDLVDFHRRCYGPRNMVVVIVGAVTPQQAFDLVSAALGDWVNPDQNLLAPFPAVQPLNRVVRKHIPIPSKKQVDLILGTLGPRRSSSDYIPASLGNSILGQFGLMGRIGDVVREQAGLAYQASTSLNAGMDTGSWEVSAGVNPENLQKAIDLILKELTHFISKPVSQEELDDSKANFIGRMPLLLESNAGVAGSLLNLERFQLGLDYYQRYPSLIQAVTPEQILEAARSYITLDSMAIISSGPDVAI